MPKTASKKPITAEKLGLAGSMVDGAKKRRGRPKKLKTLEEVKADIDRRNPTYVSPLTGGLLPGTGPKEPKKDKMMEFLTNVLQPSLTKIEENLGKILGNFDKQIEAEKEKQDDLRVSEDTASDKAREKKLEKPKEKGMLGSSIDKAIKPVTGMMDMIMNFFKNILLGSAVMGLIKILENPEIIMKPLRDFSNGIIDFVNMLIKGINRFVLGPINFIVDGLRSGLGLLIKPFAFIAEKFGVPFELPLDNFTEKVEPIQIKEIPRIEPKANMQGGGEVPGQGTGDTVPAMLEPGEFVMSKGAVQNEGLENLEQMNAEGGGTNKPIMKDGTTYAKGGGAIDVKGKGNTGKMTMKDSDGKQTHLRPFNVVSGKPGFDNIPQEMRNDVSGEGYPMPDGTYKVHSFDEHGPLAGALRGLGDWSAYVGSGNGNMGNRSGMMIHSDIDPYGTLGCIGVDLGGKPGTMAEKGFLKAWNMANPETITVDFGAPTGSTADGPRSETADNSIAKMSSTQSGSKTTPPPTPNGGNGGLVAMGSGNSGNSGGLTSGNAPAAKSGAKRFSSSDVRDDSNIIVQSIYNLVG